MTHDPATAWTAASAGWGEPMATILVIDDDSGLRDVMRRALTSAGHVVVQAENGRIGLEAIRRAPPDLVITDLLMPEREGLQVIRELRANGSLLPILAISGGGRTARLDFLDLARELGADETLAKPFRPRELVAAVARLLG